MIDPPRITQTTDQPSAMIRITIARDEIRTVMGPSLQELMVEVARQGIAITGPWFTHHLRIDPQVFDFEICVPVESTVAAAGRVCPSRWPVMSVARTIYHGSYEWLGSAWVEFDAWIKANGQTPAEDLWERYLAGPESSADPAAWRTELNRPIVR
jgi:effector-binding domain-containing protein